MLKNPYMYMLYNFFHSPPHWEVLFWGELSLGRKTFSLHYDCVCRFVYFFFCFASFFTNLFKLFSVIFLVLKIVFFGQLYRKICKGQWKLPSIFLLYQFFITVFITLTIASPVLGFFPNPCCVNDNILLLSKKATIFCYHQFFQDFW